MRTAASLRSGENIPPRKSNYAHSRVITIEAFSMGRRRERSYELELLGPALAHSRPFPCLSLSRPLRALADLTIQEPSRFIDLEDRVVVESTASCWMINFGGESKPLSPFPSSSPHSIGKQRWISCHWLRSSFSH